MKKNILFLFLIFYLLTFANQRTLQGEISHQEKIFSTQKNSSTLKALVNAYLNNTQYSSAHKALRQIDYKSLDLKGKANWHLLTALVYKYEGKNDLSLTHFLASKKKLKKLNFPEEMLRLNIEMIEFYRKIGDHKQAEQLYYRSFWFANQQKIKNLQLWNKLYNRYAAVLNESNRGHISIHFSNKAIQIAQKLNDLNAIATSFNELGFSYRNLQKPLISLDYYNKAFESWRNIGFNREAARAKLNYLLIISGNVMQTPKERLPYFFQLLEFIDQNQVEFPKSEIYDHISFHYVWLNDYKNALKYRVKNNEESAIENGKRNEIAMQNVKESYENDLLVKQNNYAKHTIAENQKEINRKYWQLFSIIIVSIVFAGLTITLYILRIRLKKSNENLKIRNEQKTILVQEIHHRVKNNLQFVRSILHMQSKLHEVNSKESLEDVSRRIDTMSLVHEMLYTDQESMSISVRDYLDRLLQISADFFKREKKIKFIIDVDDIQLPLEKLIATGIICSELLTNSVKHAFTNQDAPIFSVKLKKENNYTVLTISDNGQEPEQMVEEERIKLGMRLIDIFSRQLGGKAHISHENGYQFRLEF